VLKAHKPYAQKNREPYDFEDSCLDLRAVCPQRELLICKVNLQGLFPFALEACVCLLTTMPVAPSCNSDSNDGNGPKPSATILSGTAMEVVGPRGILPELPSI